MRVLGCFGTLLRARIGFDSPHLHQIGRRRALLGFRGLPRVRGLFRLRGAPKFVSVRGFDALTPHGSESRSDVVGIGAHAADSS